MVIESMETEKKKEKKYSYISPQRVLSKKEYEEYKHAKIESQRQKYFKRMEKLRQESKGFSKYQKYTETKTGKISKGFVRTARFLRKPTRELYQRQDNTNSQKIQRIRLQQMKLRQLRQQQERLNYSQIFSDFRNPLNNIPLLLEKEISIGSNSASSIGDKFAFDINRESFFNANIGDIGNFFNSVNQETKNHSNNIVNNPLLNVSRESLIFSNIIP